MTVVVDAEVTEVVEFVVDTEVVVVVESSEVVVEVVEEEEEVVEVGIEVVGIDVVGSVVESSDVVIEFVDGVEESSEVVVADEDGVVVVDDDVVVGPGLSDVVPGFVGEEDEVVSSISSSEIVEVAVVDVGVAEGVVAVSSSVGSTDGERSEVCVDCESGIAVVDEAVDTEIEETI